MFEFVTIIHPDEIRNGQHQKRIRQHAVRTGKQNKWKEEASRNDNFITSEVETRTGKLRL